MAQSKLTLAIKNKNKELIQNRPFQIQIYNFKNKTLKKIF